MAQHAQHKLWLLILVVLIAVSAFVRLYRIGDTHTFHNDEGRDVLITLKMIDSHKPVLLGPQTSTGNMYLGPLYYYLMVPALLISRMDPVGPAVMVALFGVATTALLFLYTKKKLGVIPATVSATVFTLTPIIVTFTRNSWNPNIVPLFAMLTLMVADKLLGSVDSKKTWLLFGLLTGILAQLHYVALLLPALIVLVLIFINRKNIRALIVGCFTAMLGFVLATLPFWLFEMRHNWVNTQALLTYISSQSGSSDAPGYLRRLLTNLTDFTEVLGSTRPNNPDTPPAFISASFWALIGLFLYSIRFVKQHTQKTGLLLSVIFFGSLLGYSLLTQKLEIHYLGFLFPIYGLISGYTLKSPGKLKFVGLALTLVVLVYNLPILVQNLNVESSHQVLRASSVATYIGDNAKGDSYNVVPGSTNSRDTTYLYFLALLDNPPVNAESSTVYMICEDSPCSQADIDSPLLFARGPAHPAIEEYLGHPYFGSFNSSRELVSMEHIVYGTWVAKIHVQ